MLEPRTPVMILVEASWEDKNGTLQAVPARMEDKSAGGACLRLQTRIPVGTRLGIQWRWEQFTGVVRYCRPEENEYVVGIQRDTKKTLGLPRPVRGEIVPSQEVRRSNPTVTVPAARIPIPPQQPESKPSEIPATVREVHNAPIVFINIYPPAAPAPVASHQIQGRASPGAQPQDIDPPRPTELRTKPPAKREEAGMEKKSTTHKWLEKASWSSKQESHSPGRDPSPSPKHDESEKENRMSQLTPLAKKGPTDAAAENAPSFQVELLPMEDIYRAVGIVTPRKGYSIKKVIEMLNSEHIRTLPKEMKRVAVLMALDAAEVPIAEVLQDAKARQQALDAHEAEQKKRAEAEWARKLEENAQIESELERIKAHHMGRITRNLEGVAREKATLNNWQTLKQHESQAMADAAELCLKASEPATAAPTAAPTEASPLKAFAKTV